MNDRVLITGGAGFIGSHLVDYCLSQNHKITVLDDFSSGSWKNLEEAKKSGDVRIIEGSITNLNDVTKAYKDCHIAFHLAVQCVRRSLNRPFENHEINSTGTLNVLEGARQKKIKRFIYCSSSEVYGNSRDSLLKEDTTVCEPVTIYGASKLAGEYYAKAYFRTYNLPTIIVRPFNSYGPREHAQGDLAEVIPRFVIRLLNNLSPVIFGSGQNGRDFTYITDTVRGIYKAAYCDALIGREVNIAYGRMMTIDKVAKILAKVCQRMELEPIYRDPRPGDVHLLHADTNLAQTLLNFKADISFEEGLEKYVSWFKEHYPHPHVLLEEDVQNWCMPT